MRYIVYDRNGYEICRDMIPLQPMWFRVLMLFDKDEILYEIQQLAAAQGDSARIKDDTTGALIEQFVNICSDENIDRPLRTIPLALSRCERIFLPWTRHNLGKHTSLKNDQQEQKELAVELSVERHFSSELAWSLMRHMQEYIEVYVLDDWAGVTYPEGRKYWAERLENIEKELRDTLSFMDDDCDAFIRPYC